MNGGKRKEKLKACFSYGIRKVKEERKVGVSMEFLGSGWRRGKEEENANAGLRVTYAVRGTN